MDGFVVFGGRMLTQSGGLLYLSQPQFLRPNVGSPAMIYSVTNSLPQAAAGLMCTNMAQKSLCCGGVNATTVLASCFTYQNFIRTRLSIAAVVSTSMPPLPSARAYGCCATLPVLNRVCCFGGINALGQLHTAIDCFDLSTNSWASLSVTVTPRRDPACILLGTNVHVMGGRDASNTSLATHEVFSDGLPVNIGSCSFPNYLLNNTCTVPTYSLLPAAPKCTDTFTATLPPQLAPTTLQRFTVHAFSDPNCTLPIGQGTPQPIATGTSTVSLSLQLAVATVHLCIRDETNPVPQPWVLLSLNSTQAGAPVLLTHFPVRAKIGTYVADPTQPLQGATFTVTVSATLGLNLASTRLRISAAADCASDANGTPLNGYTFESGSTAGDISAIAVASSPVNPAFVCISDGAGGWYNVEPSASKLVVLEKDKTVSGIAQGTGVTSGVLAGLTALAGPAAAATSLADVQVMALLGKFDCAPVSIKSYSSGNNWLLSPFANVKVSSDPDFNNLVGSLGFILVLSALHSLVVLLFLERQAPADELNDESVKPLNPKQTIVEQFTLVHNTAKAKLKFPKLELTLSMFLYQGFTLSAVKVMFARTISHQSVALLVLAGLVGFVVVPIGFLTYLSWFVVKSLRSTLDTPTPPVNYVPYNRDKYGNVVREAPMPLKMLVASHYWRNVQPEYTTLYGPLFSDYTRENYWFTVITILRSLSIALVLGTGRAGCEARVATVFAILTCFAIALLWRRPYRDPFSKGIRIVVACLHAFVALSGVTSAVHPVLPGIVSVASVLMTADSMWLIVKFGYNWWALRQIAASEAQHLNLDSEAPSLASSRRSNGDVEMDSVHSGRTGNTSARSASVNSEATLTATGHSKLQATDDPLDLSQPATPVTGATGVSVHMSSGSGNANDDPPTVGNFSFTFSASASMEPPSVRSNV
eukprot:TRINITY_DN4059_c0_g1_i1.p1 TRINITY_DN4059_c0_g1~~TRINITY_DN4059_c0_g1_i1.p1  ORF type:complete len:1083 (-),score=107.11 TRINITY_DN4059_c0_g1_i1:9-2795(-)